jgi:hypothetical protein
MGDSETLAVNVEQFRAGLLGLGQNSVLRRLIGQRPAPVAVP